MTTIDAQQTKRELKRVLHDVAVCAACVIGYAAVAPVVGAIADYVAGWGIYTGWMVILAWPYFFLVEPCLIYWALYRLHNSNRFGEVLVFGQAVILTILLTGAIWFGLGTVIGNSSSVEVQGIYDHIKYMHFGPTLTTWAQKEVDDHKNQRLKPDAVMTRGGYYNDNYPGASNFTPLDAPARIRAILPNDDPLQHPPVTLNLDPTRPPRGVIVHVGSAILIVIVTSPSARGRWGGVEPYPGITVFSIGE